jgi:hypothetical protein
VRPRGRECVYEIAFELSKQRVARADDGDVGDEIRVARFDRSDDETVTTTRQ